MYLKRVFQRSNTNILTINYILTLKLIRNIKKNNETRTAATHTFPCLHDGAIYRRVHADDSGRAGRGAHGQGQAGEHGVEVPEQVDG